MTHRPLPDVPAPGRPIPLKQEEAFAKAFLLSEKRARFIQQLSDPRRRPEMLERISLGLPYDREAATEVPGYQDFPAELERLLIAKGAGPTCYVIADRLKLDRKELSLRQALDAVCLHPFGAILVCVPGRLAYYKPASPAPGILLERP